MLITIRREGETISFCGKNKITRIKIIKAGESRVKLAICAPKDVDIYRQEILNKANGVTV